MTNVVTSVVTMHAAGVRGGGHPPGAGRQPRHGAAAAARHRGLGRGRLQENQGAGLEEQVSITFTSHNTSRLRVAHQLSLHN